MEGTYEVISGGQAVGSVTITRQGLYYHFACQCFTSGEVMFRLIMEVNETKQDLGILVPMGGYFGLHARLSIKKQGSGKPKFFLKPKRTISEGCMISISPEEPFGYLSKLESAYLARQNGKIMVEIRK